MSSDRVSVIIVGGGAIGCCTAYYLTRAGAQVTLLERGPLCREASSANAGMVSVSNRAGVLLPMAQESVRLIDQASEEFETGFEFARRGSLALLRTEEEVRHWKASVEEQQHRGVDIRLVDRETALELEPAISREILAGVYCPIDYTVTPYAMTLAFARAARRLGATLRTGVEVTALKSEGGRVRTAVTRDGEVTGDVLVMAAGAWSPFLTRTIGLDLAIEPSRGQIMITEAMRPLSWSTIKDTGHTYILHTGRGRYIIGSVSENVGFNKRLAPEMLHHYGLEAPQLVPPLKRARIIRAWAGLRPLTPDGLPFLGRVAGYEDLILATGHSRSGIGYSAVTSKMVADLITTGKADFPFEPFSATRFAA